MRMNTSPFAYRRTRSDLGPRGGLLPHHKEAPPECQQVTVWLKPIGGTPLLPDIGLPGLTYDNPSSSSSLLRDPRDSPTDPQTDRLLPQRHGVTSSLHTPYDSIRPASSGDGVVSFCDWSHGHCRAANSGGTATVDYRSASAMSGKEFPVPVMSADRSSKRARLRQWRGGGRDGLGGGHLVHTGRPAASLMGPAPSRLDGSRMFLRHKTGVTKGEKEIMMGICQNRGDLPRASYPGCTDCLVGTSGLISHHDAWSYGKVASRLFPPVSATGNTHHGRQESWATQEGGTSGRGSVYVLDTRTPSAGGRRNQSSSHHIDPCMTCAKPRDQNHQHKSAVNRSREVPSSSKGKIPPPSTPVPLARHSPVPEKSLQVKPHSMNIMPKPGGSTPRPKLLLNVHLPRVPSSSARPGEDRDLDMEFDDVAVGDADVQLQSKTAWDQQDNESR